MFLLADLGEVHFFDVPTVVVHAFTHLSPLLLLNLIPFNLLLVLLHIPLDCLLSIKEVIFLPAALVGLIFLLYL